MPAPPREPRGPVPPWPPPGDRTAGALLSGAAAGERSAWEEIISRHGGLVIRAAVSAGLSRADASDAAQLTWLRLWQHGHQIRDPDRLAGWLARTARREAIRLAAVTRPLVLCADPLGDERGTPGAATWDADPAERDYDGTLQRALRRLPSRYRTLLALLTSDLGLSYAEVAARMSLPRGSIGPMRLRAIQLLVRTPEFTGSFPRPSGAAGPARARPGRPADGGLPGSARARGAGLAARRRHWPRCH